MSYFIIAAITLILAVFGFMIFKIKRLSSKIETLQFENARLNKQFKNSKNNVKVVTKQLKNTDKLNKDYMEIMEKINNAKNQDELDRIIADLFLQ